MSHVCCVLSQAMSPWRLTVRKTGGLDISLKEASSSRSVRAPPGKENEQRLCRHIQGRGGAGLHNWLGEGWVLASVNSKDGLETGDKSQAETAVHTQNALFLQKASGWLRKPWNLRDGARPDHLLYLKSLLVKTAEVGHIYRTPTQQHWASTLNRTARRHSLARATY